MNSKPPWPSLWSGSDLEALAIPSGDVGFEPQRQPVRLRWIAVGAFVGILVSLAASILATLQLHHEDNIVFKTQTQNYLDTLKRSFLNVQILLHTVRGISNRKSGVSREYFVSLAHDINSFFPSIDAIAWVPRIKVKEIDATEKSAQSDGHPQLVIKNADGTRPQDTLNPEDDIYPVYLVTPETIGRRSSLGINILSIPGRRDILYRACMSGDILISHWPVLANSESGNGHIVFYLAVYANDQSNVHPYEACGHLKGYLTALLRVDRLMATSFYTLPSLAADVYLIDVNADHPQRRLAVFPATHQVPAFIPLSSEEALLQAQRTQWLEVGGLEMTLAFVPLPRGWIERIPLVAWLVLGFGLLSTAILTAFFAKQRQATLDLMAEVDRRFAVECALRASEIRFRLALRDSNVSVSSHDQDLRYTWVCNANIGLQSFEIIGRRPSDLYDPEANRALMSLMSSVLETGIGVRSEVPLVTDNRTTIKDIRIEAIFDKHGVITGIICVSIDVTESKQMKEDLKKAVDAAERANAAKSRFLAAASHDLRQPFQAMQIYHELLLGKLRDPQQRDLGFHLGDSIRAGRELLTALLDVSTLDAGTVTPKIALFPLQASFDSLLMEFDAQAARRGLRLTILPTRVIINSDRVLLERVLRNLLTNAMRYTHTGRLLIGCRHRSDHVAIEVWDTGEGIAADKLDLIFEDFYQVGNIERQSAQGLGLGLGIVARTLKLLGHNLTVRSWPGRGSVFTVIVADYRDKIAPMLLPPIAADRREIPPQRVLIIEDDDRQRRALRLLLEQDGHTVWDAASAEQARALVIQALLPPTLIISDLRLPGPLTGIEAIADLRAVVGVAIPALLVTGDTDRHQLRFIAAANIVILHKPFNQSALKDCINAILSLSQLPPHECNDHPSSSEH